MSESKICAAEISIVGHRKELLVLLDEFILLLDKFEDPQFSIEIFIGHEEKGDYIDEVVKKCRS